MFDFMDSDWFTIGLEIVFLLLISYDVKRYRETKKGEFLVNIVITIGFAIWTLYPYYNSYFGWEDSQKEKMLSVCENDANKTVCICIDEKVFKEYTHQDYMAVDKNSSEYLEFMKEAKEDCMDDGWF
ncbi:hypothetical protein [Sulfurimonas marina]|uniref:Uncharacterized protein n=1 Tax=Sulfurimonas marina TaxID=2590551 RepID=A0A7M1AWA3_9BACT|nr:hypothetical protein [Sulfurimonas marina]QOP41751.1 hypothetical protein FJR03_08370 [Sulfurimonas marina]